MLSAAATDDDGIMMVSQVESALSGITKQRMMDNGIGMDLVSLSQPPMHTVPLFICRDKLKSREGPYEVPHWMHISFFDGTAEVRTRWIILLTVAGVRPLSHPV
jgi:hypothetical protein